MDESLSKFAGFCSASNKLSTFKQKSRKVGAGGGRCIRLKKKKTIRKKIFLDNLGGKINFPRHTHREIETETTRKIESCQW